MRHLFLTVATIATALLFTGCQKVTAPPEGAVPFDPPAEYRVLWGQMESCSGLRGSIDDVSWYYVPRAIIVNGGEAGGVWYSNGNRIFLVERHLSSKPLVRHEMLHALVRAGGHPYEYFYDRCVLLLH